MLYKFTNEFAPGRFDEIIDFSLGPRLFMRDSDYPDMMRWAEETHQKLRRGAMKAMVAFDHRRPVGTVIYSGNYSYRQHPIKAADAAIRRLTVRPDHRGRHIASFLLRNTELEAQREFGASSIAVDSKVHNLAIKLFLLKHGYNIAAKLDLYGLGAGEDYIYRKQLPRGFAR